MFVSTLETLPDEILLIIFQYFNDIYFLFHTFLGLNQRFNHILLDKQIYLLAKLINIKKHDRNFSRYSNSELFKTITHQLSSANKLTKKSRLQQCFRALVQYHLQEQYVQMKSHVEQNISHHKSIRFDLSSQQRTQHDAELKKTFENLHNPFQKPILRQIQTLVHAQGASLEYNEHEQAGFYFADDFRELVFSSSSILASQIFQTLFISNPSLLKYPCYGGGHRFSIYEYLVYSIYYSTLRHQRGYQALSELILFATQCQKYESDDEIWLEKTIMIILDVLSKSRRVPVGEVLIYATQLEILKILLNEYRTLARKKRSDGELISQFKYILDSLIENNRLDIILLIYRDIDFFQKLFHDVRQFVSIMLENQLRRKLFHRLIKDKLAEVWLINEECIFLLLEKKDRRLIEQFLQSSPSSIHQLDKDGNNLLLFTCLKVAGRRYRLVELLIQIGCDPQQENSHGMNFYHALHLHKNRWLLHNLIKRTSINVPDRIEQI
ncbi:unnamed protein product [Adineta ricciae]|uniref:Uncharacterized protein n=1 Tax=Adineta ricciae TaxID=249248 RepID=A0A813PS79_ADIRI|nr:unnamed protein product [Adineta ricciae]CAF1254791.1 unnamed protein product [Adineta ricciae]